MLAAPGHHLQCGFCGKMHFIFQFGRQACISLLGSIRGLETPQGDWGMQWVFWVLGTRCFSPTVDRGLHASEVLRQGTMGQVPAVRVGRARDSDTNASPTLLEQISHGACTHSMALLKEITEPWLVQEGPWLQAAHMQTTWWPAGGKSSAC